MKTKLLFFLLFMCALVGRAFAQSQIKHVIVIALENHEYSQVIGNPNMPYLNELARKGALATQFYANTHPSLPNYFRMTTGQNIATTDAFTGTVTANNIVRQLLARGKTWKNYAEDLPYAGYLGTSSGGYVRKHDPFSFFNDVLNSTAQRNRIVPLSLLATDLATNALPSFSFIQVSDYHNGHDCPKGMSTCTDTQKLITVDNWLLSHVPTILNDPVFKQSGLLVIWWDEGTTNTRGGGHIAVVFTGPYARAGFRSSTLYTHDNVLRTFGQIFSFSTFPGNSANVKSMSDMLNSTAATATTGVFVSSPVNGSTVSSPVHAAATAKVSGTLARMELWVDGVKKYTVQSSSLSTNVSLAGGKHRFAFLAVNTAGMVWSKVVYATVS